MGKHKRRNRNTALARRFRMKSYLKRRTLGIAGETSLQQHEPQSTTTGSTEGTSGPSSAPVPVTLNIPTPNPKLKRSQPKLDPAEVLPEVAKGRRILTVESIISIGNKFSEHLIRCKKGKISLASEIRRGVQTLLCFTCSCGFCFEEDSDLGRGPNEANDALICAAQSCGSSFCTAKSIMEEVLEIECTDFD